MIFDLGRDINIPALGLGTWQLSGNSGSKALEMALQLGYRHIDTAQMYGNEAEIGKVLQTLEIDRVNIFITTKVWTSSLGAKLTEKAFQKSLENLKTDYIDLYLIHWPGNNEKKRNESYGKMMEMRDNLKVRQIGVSNFSVGQIKSIHDQYAEYPIVNQIYYNFRNFNREVVNYCKDKGIQIVGYTPLNKGVGLDKQYLQTIAKNHNKTPAQIVLRWMIQDQVATIPKSSSPVRLKENFDIFDFELTLEEMNIISKQVSY